MSSSATEAGNQDLEEQENEVLALQAIYGEGSLVMHDTPSLGSGAGLGAALETAVLAGVGASAAALAASSARAFAAEKVWSCSLAPGAPRTSGQTPTPRTDDGSE